MNANDSLQPTALAKPVAALRWHETLSFKLSLSFVLMLLLLMAAAAIAGKLLVHRGLVDDSFRAERDSGLRLALQFNQTATRAEDVARSLAATALALAPEPAALQLAGAALLERQASVLPINAIGIWPQAGALRPGVERASLLWLLGSDGRAQLRSEYNSPRVSPYWREKWYTPAAHLEAQRCYWSLTAQDPLSRSTNLLCSLPLRRDERFIGVVTVSLPVAALLPLLDQLTREDPGYALLLDADNQILAASAALAKTLPEGRLLNLAGLARQFPPYNPLALALHERKQELLAEYGASPLADAEPQLQQATRELSQQDAANALLAIWMAAAGERLWQAKPAFLQLEHDPVLGGRSYVSAFELGYPGWRLLRISGASSGFPAADLLFLRTLAVLAAASTVLLLLAYLALGGLVLRPLRRIVAQMAETAGTHDTLRLLDNDKSADELGLFAHWHNERVRQVRDLSDRNRSLSSQAVSESQERRNSQDAVTRLQERQLTLLQSLDEAVVSVDENGRIDDLNPAAERLGATALQRARGQPFGAVFAVRGSEDGEDAPDLARLAIERGTRIDYAENLRLAPRGGAEVQVSVSATPVRARNNRVVGAIIVLRPRTAQVVSVAAAGAPAVAEACADPLTGLELRAACERRVQELIEAAKLAPRSHALLWIDVDQLARVNDSGGAAAGDAVLTRLAELLRNLTGTAGEIFRIAADEFAVLLGNSSSDRARTFAEALRRTVVSSRFLWEGRQFNITISVGVCEFSGQSEGAADILRRASEAGEAAKRAGRNSVKVYDDSMSRHKPGADDPVWVRRIRAGLQQNLLHLTTQPLQPQGSVAAQGKAYDLQLALEDEEGFWTAAPGFMPAAERNRLASELDRWTVQRTLALLSMQPAPLGEVALACITLSAPSLADPRFADGVMALLTRHPGVKPATLCFLAPQELLLQHPQSAQSFASMLRSLGCRLAIDRFALRSASELALLRRVPSDLVRIDAAAYPAIADEPLERGLAEAAVRLARGLGCRIIVNNLDDARRLEAWQRIGADYLQGDVLGRATPLVLPSSAR